MNRIFYSCLFTLLPASVLGQSLATPDFDSWYQIEIIVFKHKRPLPSDEIWPLEDIGYPYNMVAIAPSSDDQITPYSLSQTEEFDPANNEAGGPAAASGSSSSDGLLFENFLFKDQVNVNHNRRLLESNNQVTPISTAHSPLGDSYKEISVFKGDTEGTPATEELGLNFKMAEALLNSPLPQAYRSLEKEAFTLSAIAGSLRRSSRYDLLKHQAWLQPIGTTATPILIQTGDRYDDLFEIDGTLSFRRSRFLHLQANLWFTRFEPLFDSTGDQRRYIQSQAKRFSDYAKNYPELIAVERNRNTHIAVHSFPLRHARRMRSSVLHFIDHPFFGVLVKIDKFTYEPEDAAE